MNESVLAGSRNPFFTVTTDGVSQGRQAAQQGFPVSLQSKEISNHTARSMGNLRLCKDIKCQTLALFVPAH